MLACLNTPCPLCTSQVMVSHSHVECVPGLGYLPDIMDMCCYEMRITRIGTLIYV